MLDPDVSTEESLRQLTAPEGDDGPSIGSGWTRRRFLQAVGAGVVGTAAVGDFAGVWSRGQEAYAATPVQANEGILVLVTFYGGNDGLNTVVPYADPAYASQRGGLAIPAASVLRLDDRYGLHPNLPFLKQRWDAGELGIVHGVGYPNPDLSHFVSMGIWMAGRLTPGPPGTGWVGRWLDGQPAADADTRAVTIGSGVPLHLVGASRRAVSVPPGGDVFGTGSQAQELRMYDGLKGMAVPAGRGVWHDAYARTLKSHLDLARQVAPSLKPAPTGSEAVKKMTMAARLVNANLGFRVLDVGIGGFDTHDGQGFRHPQLLKDIDDSLAAFYATLAPAWRRRVTILTWSEFGRTPFANGSNGTDHGTSNVMFVVGDNVRGGHHGTAPPVKVANQWTRQTSTTDFRAVFGSVVDGWLGGGGSSVMAGSFTPLDLFVRAPGVAPAVVPPPPPPPGPTPPPPGAAAPPGCYRPITPTRVFDTRDGTGGRLGALGPGETWTVGLAGTNGIPAEALAVVLNLTAVGATGPTYVTAWPAGAGRPNASTLNPTGPAPVANLAVCALSGGAVNLFNQSGTVDLVADVVGCFVPEGSGCGVVPLTPDRLLDTRDGTGGTVGPVAGGVPVRLQVGGRGGVPGNAAAAFLNLTVVEPSVAGFAAAWPGGTAWNGTSSINFVARETRANLVVAPLGADGSVDLMLSAGTGQLVVDVLGALVPGGGGSFVPIFPWRALDTRDGTGDVTGPVGQGASIDVCALVGGVPADATGVLVNVTAVDATAPTYVCVHPCGEDRPLASNLNPPPATAIPNAVLARLGTGGKVRLYNNTGSIQLVMDVLGYVR